MQPYLDLVRDILQHGSWQDNRTGIRTRSLPGASLRFDLKLGFPAITTKKLAFRTAMGELVGFLRGSRSAAEFRALGCGVWDQNANENAAWLANPFRQGVDDLGPIYGVQWRNWPAYKEIDVAHPHRARQIAAATQQGFHTLGTVIDHTGKESLLLYKAIDQLRHCLDTLIRDPGNRRILFHGWNWAQLDEMALPPCHLLYQFLANPQEREISLCLYIRSNDIGLGAPFNIASSAALLTLMGRLSGYHPRWLTYFIGDAHIYENHLPMLATQLTRAPLALPQLRLASRIPDYATTPVYAPEWLDQVEPEDFILEGYQHHPPLKATMAV
ncbi:MAG: thymidylate synthase [Ferrovum sp.]|nr:thymidylate synthase [Ferrovum sp.]NDU87782.1 thymidylate synthase [Ferrovum sp.]